MPTFDASLAGSRLVRAPDAEDGGTLLGELWSSADVESIRDARRFVRQTLGVQAVATTATDDAELIVSELLTNVALHCGDSAEPEAVVRLVVTEKCLRIEVHDGSSLVPVHRAASDSAEDGRGLLVVSALAERWGWEPTAYGKYIWCELAVSRQQTTTQHA